MSLQHWTVSSQREVSLRRYLLDADNPAFQIAIPAARMVSMYQFGRYISDGTHGISCRYDSVVGRQDFMNIKWMYGGQMPDRYRR